MNIPSVRQIKAKVELFLSSTGALVSTYTEKDKIKSITIERLGEEGKFFGFGVCQKVNLKLIDTKRELNISTANSFKITIDGVDNFPTFYVSEVRRDENTNELSITAYDLIYKANSHTVSEIVLDRYTIEIFAKSCANLIGAKGIAKKNVSDDVFSTYYENGANFEGTENLRDALKSVSEATQTVFYLDNNNTLVFKRMTPNELPVAKIDKSNYFDLDSKTNRRLTAVAHITELGDNVSASLKESGSTAYIRNNPFWDMRDDIAQLVEKALSAVGGLTLNQFSCSWRGASVLSVGDKIEIETKDSKTVSSYILNDSIEYTGALHEKTSWQYKDEESESSNPSSLGEALKETFAKVDKQKKQIDLIAGKSEQNSHNIGSLQVNTNEILASVNKTSKDVQDSLDNVNGQIAEISSQVQSKMSAEDVRLEIQKSKINGADKVETSTGFTFDENGLKVSKNSSEMETQITEDGMTVYKNRKAVLTANNSGVDAENLHATTYLIIGKNSRLEDYGSKRTGCFWIGE